MNLLMVYVVGVLVGACVGVLIGVSIADLATRKRGGS